MYLHTGDEIIDLAFRTAIGDVLGNIAPLASGLLKQDRPVLMAGLDYDSPWTRDAAFNVWNGVALLIPEVARDTLLSVLDVTGDQVRIGGQYWDAVIWAAGAWSYHLHTADRSLLPIGVIAVEGDFERGDVVACVDEHGVECGRGLVNYSSADTARILRQPSARIADILGHLSDPELIHRDNMVVVRPRTSAAPG